MFQDSVIAQRSIQAYQETHYHVLGATPLTLHIGVANQLLSGLHKLHSVESSAYVTACNPFSQNFGKLGNDQRQAVLLRELEQLGLTHIEGIGRHPSDGWPGERSILVLGMSHGDPKSLNVRYEQNAVVWRGFDAVPKLVLLR